MVLTEEQIVDIVKRTVVEVMKQSLDEIYEFLGVQRVIPKPRLEKIPKPSDDVQERFYRHGDKVLSQLESQLSDIMTTAQRARK